MNSMIRVPDPQGNGLPIKQTHFQLPLISGLAYGFVASVISPLILCYVLRVGMQRPMGSIIGQKRKRDPQTLPFAPTR